MKGGEGKLVLAIVACTAAGAFGIASLAFSLPAVAEELGLSLSSRSMAMKVPVVSSLVILFLAGALSDRLGRRTVATWGGLLYCAGALIVMASPSLIPLVTGRVLEGIGSSTLVIVAVAMTRSGFAEEKRRAVVYGAQTATTPAIYVVAPMLGAILASQLTWRTVPVLWLLLGGLATLAAWRYFPRAEAHPDHRPELLSPTLAGVTLAGVAAAAAAVGSGPIAVGIGLGVALAAGIALLVTLQTIDEPTLDLSPLRLGGFRLSLLAAGLPVAASFYFFTTLLIEYHFDYGLVATAGVMAPASALSVAAGLAAGRSMARRGPVFTAILGLAIAGASGVATLLVTTNSPALVPALIVCGYAVGDTVAIAALTANVLNRVPGAMAGAGSSLRKASTALGATAGALAAAFFVWSSYESAIATSVDRTTIVSEEDARGFAKRVREGEGSELLAQRLAVEYDSNRPLIDRREEILEEAEIAGYRTSGIVLAVVYGLTITVLLHTRRRYPLPAGQLSSKAGAADSTGP